MSNSTVFNLRFVADKDDRANPGVREICSKAADEIKRLQDSLETLATWRTYNDGYIPVPSAERLRNIAVSGLGRDPEGRKS